MRAARARLGLLHGVGREQPEADRDLVLGARVGEAARRFTGDVVEVRRVAAHDGADEDRKSTRLNSSHGYISYAVFCLKKKKRNHTRRHYSLRHDVKRPDSLIRSDTTRTPAFGGECSHAQVQSASLYVRPWRGPAHWHT